MQKVVSGQLTNIEPRSNGWFAVHILAPGKQHPVKLSTKREDILGQAQALAWQHVDALYNEEQSDNINPHNGQPYVNRYLEQLAPAGSMPAPAPQMPAQPQQPMAVPTTMMPAQPQQQPQQFGNLQPQLPPQPAQMPVAQPPAQPVQMHGFVSDDEREARIMRQAATKVAAAFIPQLAEEDRNLGSLIRISEQLLKYYREGVSWETNGIPQPQPVAAQGGGEYADPGREAGDPGPGGFPEGY